MSPRGVAVLASLAVSGSCVYTSGSGLPEHVRTVRVEVFENRTGYPGLEAELAAALVREFEVDGTLVPSTRAADSVLTGRIVALARSVLQEDALDDVVTGQVALEAVISLHDAHLGEGLLEHELVTSRDVRDAEGVYRRRRGQTELDARGSALRELARNVVRRCVEVW
jgi:hypothetical protein